MAITTYENKIPPTLEHLVWGGDMTASFKAVVDTLAATLGN